MPNLLLVMLGGPADRPLWMFLGAGVLGGFTTLSASSFDIFAMLQRSEFAVAGAYIPLSVVGSVLALILGYWIGRATA